MSWAPNPKAKNALGAYQERAQRLGEEAGARGSMFIVTLYQKVLDARDLKTAAAAYNTAERLDDADKKALEEKAKAAKRDEANRARREVRKQEEKKKADAKSAELAVAWLAERDPEKKEALKQESILHKARTSTNRTTEQKQLLAKVWKMEATQYRRGGRERTPEDAALIDRGLLRIDDQGNLYDPNAPAPGEGTIQTAPDPALVGESSSTWLARIPPLAWVAAAAGVYFLFLRRRS